MHVGIQWCVYDCPILISEMCDTFRDNEAPLIFPQNRLRAFRVVNTGSDVQRGLYEAITDEVS